MALRGDVALAILEKIGKENAKGEYYLTDAVALARAAGHQAAVVVVPEAEVHGVNDRSQLADAERMIQERLRQAAMLSGVTMVAPETVFLSYDTRLGRDVIIEPHVVFGPGVVVERGAVIHSFSHLEGAHIQPGAAVGPFARLRPGASIGEKAKVGNFVEIKNSVLGTGAKVGHLTYLGDASCRRRGEYRRRHHHVQLRRVRQVPHGDRAGRLHRLEFLAGRARHDRRRRLRRLRLGDHRRRAGRGARRSDGDVR